MTHEGPITRGSAIEAEKNRIVSDLVANVGDSTQYRLKQAEVLGEIRADVRNLTEWMGANEQRVAPLAQRMRDADIDALFTLATTDGILPLVRQTARFNRHRDFILALLRHQPARRALFGRLASPV